MGNDPGKEVNDQNTSQIVFEIKGPFPEKVAGDFKKALEELFKQYEAKAKSKGIYLQIKK